MSAELIRQDTDYAMRALVHLALAGQGTRVPAAAIAVAEAIPLNFARKILRQLHLAGIVDRTMGPGGGFALSQSPDRITLLRVVEAVQGRVAVGRCGSDGETCPRRPHCPVSRALAALERKLREALEGVTVGDVVNTEGAPSAARSGSAGADKSARSRKTKEG